MPAAVLALPGDRPVGLQMRVLDPRRRIGPLVHDVGLAEALGHVADLALERAEDVAVLRDDVVLVVQQGGARFHRGHRVEHRRQDLVVDGQGPHAGLGCGLAFGHDRGDALPGEARDVVQHVGVVGIDEVILVQGRAVEPAGHVFPGIDRDHARHAQGLGPVDARDARMGVRRAQHLQVQQALNGGVHRVARLAGQDGVGKRVRQAGAAGLAGQVLLDVDPAVQRVLDRAIARTAAEVALQGMRQIVLVRLECGRGRGHDHAGRTVAALEGLGVVEGLLHRMKRAVLGEPLDGRDPAAFAAEGGHEAGMVGLAVDPHGAGAAVAGVAALLDAEHFKVAQEGAQALAGFRLGGVAPAIDVERAHASSARICSAK